jgi:hypothetical protein
MQRTAALLRIEENEPGRGQRETNLRRLRRKMDCSFEIHSRGVEAARRPQLTPVPTLHKYPDRCGHYRRLSLFVTCFKTISRLSSAWLSDLIEIPCVEWGEGSRKSVPGNGQSKFKSVKTKSLINGFTNRLGPVYPARIINRMHFAPAVGVFYILLWA